MQRPVYVADTSMWIRLVKSYPATVFPSLARRCDALIKDQRLVSPRTVLDEISAGNDEVVAWAGRHESVFVDDTGATVARMGEIQADHPSLGGSGDGPDRADPYLIALALSIGESNDEGPVPVIVTEESPRGGEKIPQVARKYGVDTCNTVGMFEREEWSF